MGTKKVDYEIILMERVSSKAEAQGSSNSRVWGYFRMNSKCFMEKACKGSLNRNRCRVGTS